MSEKKQEQALADRKTLYLCDWRKNTECRKTSCFFNPTSQYRTCYMTTELEKALLDEQGKPIVSPEWRQLWTRIRA